MKVRPKYFRLDERSNALDYLRKVRLHLAEVENDQWAWKWVFIALHGALYGFAITVAKGTDDSSVVKQNGRLVSFWSALKHCQNIGALEQLTESQKKSLERLAETLRNEFMHFQPKGWSIEVHGFPKIVIEVLGMIRALSEHPNVFIHLSGRQIEEVRSVCFQGTKAMRRNPLFLEVNAHE